MRILYDYHLHSQYSGDSSTPAFEMISRAVSCSLKGMCFTDHLDLDGPTGGIDMTLDFPAYFHGLKELKEKYADDIKVGIGLEFGIQPHLSSTLHSLSQKWPFDFVIASQHFVEGMDPYFPEYFNERTERQGYETFFREEYDSLKALSREDYDTLGHLDYIIRYGPNKNRFFSYASYADFIDPILRLLIENGKCLEVNTGGFKAGLGGPNPGEDILRRYRELGGEKITIGSDAHAPEGIALEFERTADLLLSLGFKYYSIFEKRRETQIPL